MRRECQFIQKYFCDDYEGLTEMTKWLDELVKDYKAVEIIKVSHRNLKKRGKAYLVIVKVLREIKKQNEKGGKDEQNKKGKRTL